MRYSNALSYLFVLALTLIPLSAFAQSPDSIAVRSQQVHLRHITTEEALYLLRDIMGDRLRVEMQGSERSLRLSADSASLEHALDLVAAVDVHRPTVQMRLTLTKLHDRGLSRLGYSFRVVEEDRSTMPDSAEMFPAGGNPAGPLPQMSSEQRAAWARLQAQLETGQTRFRLDSLLAHLSTAGLASTTPSERFSALSDKEVQTTLDPIHLRVIPSVTRNGMIRLKLRVARSEPEAHPASYGCNRGTEMILKDGENVLFGGLSTHEPRSIQTGMPGLRDLPLVGRLFGRNERYSEVHSYLFMLSATIEPASEDGT